MGSTTDKISGVANQAAGKVKETAGKVTGSKELEAEGLAQEGAPTRCQNDRPGADLPATILLRSHPIGSAHTVIVCQQS